MKERAEQVKKEIEEKLKTDKENNNKVVECVLINPITNETITIVNDRNEEIIVFAPYTNKENGYKNDYAIIPDWDFNFDGYVFEPLEKGYFVGYMNNNMHYGIWQSLLSSYPYDIDYKDGVQVYLQFCADNNITKEYLDDETYNDVPDAMKYFKGLKINETMEYKGYIIEADDLNVDNPKENLIHIYNNKKDYENGEPIETISLNSVGIKEEIKDYIDETYFSKNNLLDEKSYYTFVLGYDLFNDVIKKYNVLECDTNYDFCKYLTSRFITSNEYRDIKCSGYEALEKWINNNKELIENEYKDFIDYRDTFGQFKIIEKGYRKDEPVALIYNKTSFKEEYIIAINYEIKDNTIIWGYGYYYDNDLKKATKDFKEVLKGNSLTNTFIQKNNKDIER